MFLYCQCRCYFPGLILVELEKRTPRIWRGKREVAWTPLWAKWDVDREATLLGLTVPHLLMCETPAAHCQLSQISRETILSDTAVHYTQTRCVNSPWQEHNWRDKGEEAVNPFPGWGSPCSTSTRELLQHCSGVQNSAPVSTAEQDAALSHLCQVYFSFRCEEGDKVSIYWIWGTSCQHSCSAKWLHVQGNPSASGWDLQPFVPFSLGLYSFLQWSEDRSQRLNNCFPVLAHSKSTDSLHFFLLLHFAFTDELLSLVINLKTLVRWGSLNLNNHLKCRSPRDRCTRKIFSVCLSWAWLLNSSLQFSFL